MKNVNGLLWTTVISGLATGWLAIVFAIANWNDDSSAAAFGLIAASLAFGMVGRALFGTLRP
jgi:hypothetical protein